MLWRGLPAYAAIVVALLAGCQRNISGYYAAGDNSAVIWLQVVRTSDNHLTGQLAAYFLRPDGAVEQNSVPVTGDVVGESVKIRGSRLFGMESFVLSGTNGNGLTLAGEQSVPRTFTRSTPAAFQSKVAELKIRSQNILRTKAGSRLNP